MPTFSGDITIAAVDIRNADGTLTPPANPFVVDSTKDQLVYGTTTLINAHITFSIYEDGNLPSPPLFLHEIRLRTTAIGPLTDPPTNPNNTPVEVPLYSDSLLSSNPNAGDATWSALVPKNTLSPSKSYTIIVHDADDLVTTSKGVTTLA